MRTLTLCLVVCLVFRLDIVRSRLDSRVQEVIEAKEEVVHRLAEAVADLFENREHYLRRCQCSRHGCTNDVSDFGCSTEFNRLTEICGESCEGRRMNFNTTTIRVPPNTDISKMSSKLKESICVSSNLDGLMEELYMGDPRSSWLYFGGVDGFYRIYPAQARERGVENGDPLLGDCKSYDPRIRPWFIAATTRSKDIVLVIDVSRSMNDPVKEGGDETRWDVTKQAVFAMLDTFSTFEYKNSKSCTGMVKMPKQGYCMIPPLGECANEEESIRHVQPHKLAKRLSAEDVMCPLGKPIDSFEAICCPNCKRLRG